MRWISNVFMIGLVLAGQTLLAAAPPTTGPVNRGRTIVATTGPVAVPYTLTDTNHILLRMKINGKGPFNLIMDTGAPLMILRVSAAQKLGLTPNNRGLAYLNSLDIEGGVAMRHVQCLVNTPFQIEGMNAVGAAGVELDGMLGYTVLSRFKLQIDLSKDKMIWTPIAYSPLPLMRRSAMNSAPDPSEDRLESMGGLLKVLGPLVKPVRLEPKHRGMLGIELADADGHVAVKQVLGESPAAAAGIQPGDHILSINKTTVENVAQAEASMASILPGQPVKLRVKRDDAELSLKLLAGEGF